MNLISNFLGNFVKGILNLLLVWVSSLLGPVLTFIFSSILNLNLIDIIVSCNNVLITYIAPSVGWFCSLIPPNSFRVIIMEIEIYITFYMFYISSGFILDILKLIKKLPFA